MAAGFQTHQDGSSESEPDDGPEISLCEGAPGRAVLLESGNTDGWIASDLTVEVRR